MNYIELVNRFWQCNEEHPIGASATSIYFYLVHTCNKLGWKDPFKHSDRHIALTFDMSVNTVRTAKNILKQRSLIDFKAGNPKGGKSLNSVTVYSFSKMQYVSNIDMLSDTLSATYPDTYPDTLSDTYPDTINKQNKTKQERNNTLELDVEIVDEFGFEKLWDLYDKKIGDKEKLRKKWDKLSKADKAAVFEYLPKYREAVPDKKFRKNLETFLNNKSWNDELIYGDKRKTTKSSAAADLPTEGEFLEAIAAGIYNANQ